MTDTAPLDTLFYPFDTGALSYPQGKTLFLNAQAHPALKHFPSLDAIQPFYPSAQGLTLSTGIAPPYEAALVHIPKDKLAAQHDLASAAGALAPGGLLAACAANDANGARLEKWFSDMGLAAQSLSKNKCRVVWAHEDKAAIAPAEWLAHGRMQSLTMGEETYWTQPGLFGWDKIDQGSRLLAAHLPPSLKGCGADFGCGYGYLSRRLLAQGVTPDSLTVIDADRRAIDCCRKNCAGVHALWADLTQPLTEKPFDWIVMNPPFHRGKKTESDIGISFIRTAAGALKKGGWLYMVANRQLPYESILHTLFTNVRQVADANGFKVIFAQK